MSDLIERLRKTVDHKGLVEDYPTGNRIVRGIPYCLLRDIEKAADHIEAQDKRIEELEADLAFWQKIENEIMEQFPNGACVTIHSTPKEPDNDDS